MPFLQAQAPWIKGTVRPDWICVRVDRLWKGHQLLQIFYFSFLILIRVQSSEPLHAKMNPTSYLFGSRFACAQTAIFSAQPCSKNAGETSILQRIFSIIKRATDKRKTRFYTNHDPNKHEVGYIFAWSGSKLWILFKYSRVNFKNQKPIAVDVLFKAYPMVPLSCRSNLAGRFFKAIVSSDGLA